MDRFIHVQIYNPNNVLVYDNRTDTSWGIVEGTVSINDFIMDSALKFGNLNSAMLQIQVFGIDADLKGYTIKLEMITAPEDYIITSAGDTLVAQNGDSIVAVYDTALFYGKIESSIQDYSGIYRRIEAYDNGYYLRDVNVSEFWDSFWEDRAEEQGVDIKEATSTLRRIRTDLLTYMNVEIASSLPALPNDSMVVRNKFESLSAITFGDMLSAICILQNTCPHFTGEGKLDFIRLASTADVDITDELEKYNSNWQDYVTQAITGVVIYNTSDDLVKLVGTRDNVYSIAGNIFLYDKEVSELEPVATAILNDLSGITYTPCDLKMIESNLHYKLGDKYETEKGYMYVMMNKLSGKLLIEQTISSPAYSATLEQMPDDINDTLINNNTIVDVKKSVQGVEVTVQELNSEVGDVTSQLGVLAGEIVLKVQTDGSLALVQLGADPSTGETSFVVKAGNFSVDADGNVAITGDITAKSKLTMRNTGDLSGETYETDVIKISYDESYIEGQYLRSMEDIDICDADGISHITFRRFFSAPGGLMYVHDEIYSTESMTIDPSGKFSAFSRRDYVQEGVQHYGHAAFAANGSASMSYIQGAQGYAGFSFNKADTSSAFWAPAICFDTYGGNSWQIGNYNNSNMEFVFATEANIMSQTNTVQKISLAPGNGTIAHSGNVVTGDDNGEIKVAGTAVAVKGLGTNAYRAASNTYTATGTTGATTTAVYNARKDVNNNLIATTWVTFDSASVGSKTLKNFSKKSTKSGYTPLGILEFNTTNGEAYLCTSSAGSDGTITLAIYNNASSAKTLTPTAKVLWVRSAIS